MRRTSKSLIFGNQTVEEARQEEIMLKKLQVYIIGNGDFEQGENLRHSVSSFVEFDRLNKKKEEWEQAGLIQASNWLLEQAADVISAAINGDERKAQAKLRAVMAIAIRMANEEYKKPEERSKKPWEKEEREKYAI